MSANLKIFPDRDAAQLRADKSTAASDLVTIALARQRFYIKMASPRPGVEPKYLCTDGRWRKYDEIIELPYSMARGGKP